MKNVFKSVAAVFSLFMCLPAQASATEIIEIIDDPVPETVASHCNVHWAVLLVIGIYAVYAALRAIANKRAMQDETGNPEEK